MHIRTYMKRFMAMAMAFIMVMTSFPYNAFAANYNYDNLSRDQSAIINKTPVHPAKLKKGETAEDLIKNPKQPDIYTLRTDYKVKRGEKYELNYQPYIASVGEAATQAEKDKVKQTVDLPDLTGYEKPHDDYTIDYDTVKDKADGKGMTGNATNGIRYQANQDFRYKPKANEIKIKHVFQDLEDFTKYTNPDGSMGEGNAHYTTQSGNTGSTMEVSPLEEKDKLRKGFVPEAPYITIQVPENAENFILEYRYNRAHYDVKFDTAGGTPLPNRTLYYEQMIPKIDDNSIPKKEGCYFLGWQPSVDLKTEDGRVFRANEIIKDGNGKPIFNLEAEIKMPAQKITFTAVWKDKEKADYAVQFWAEKADHADDASLLEKYDFIGARVYKDQDTGKRPVLKKVSIDGVVFPDLDKARLDKIWKAPLDKEGYTGPKGNGWFNKNEELLLNKFYVYNKTLTADQNKDPKDARLVKSVSATGKTVYNIYFDRQVYDLYFTQSNYLAKTRPQNTFYPEVYKFDEKQNRAVKVGGPGDPYHFKARFNQLMLDWPNDGMQIKGFTSGNNSHGWSPNMSETDWWSYRDTPPYRLSADQFLDFPEYESKGGYTRKIDAGEGKTIDVNDFKTLSFGIEQYHDSIPHHMDFWMDGFKDGETIIRYDLYRSKADTESLGYGHKYTVVQGFTPYGFTGTDFNQYPTVRTTMVDEDEIDDLNDERDEVTPFDENKKYKDIFNFEHTVGHLVFIQAFFNDADEYGDPDPSLGIKRFKKNGYLRYKYKRNKYPLRFNYDPQKTKDDSEFGPSNQIQTFYNFPLKVLSPDLVPNETPREEREYFKDNPANFLDNPENLKKLGLTDLVFTDPKDGKLKVKRPDNLTDQMVFKGWALDPSGTKLIWENKDEKMPSHAVNLYAKWDEPDFKWKVTFDPDGGKLRRIDEKTLTQKQKTIQEGDIGQEETKTYPIKEANEGDKQVFTVIQRQKLVEPSFKPIKKGYDFLGWEVIRYKKDKKGDYTTEIDNSYRETYKVPELYTFGNDVVSPIYLKAIWVPNQRVDVDIEHYFLDKDYNLDKTINPNPEPDKLEDKRAGYLVATTGDKQDDKYILVPHQELEEHKKTSDVYKIYKEYNDRVKGDNTFFQQLRVEPEKILDPETGKPKDNPNVKNNVFKFFYRPYRQREYKVNYIDERFKNDPEKGKIIDQELVTNGNRHFDARNYRPIPGWKLVSDPQQQLFFDVDEKTNEFKGINGTGKDEITFYYKDVRAIEVPGDKEPPEGYVRVTFKADKGGSFGKDAEGKDITELHYDVIKGLKSDLLPVPQELKEGEEKVSDKYYVTPDDGKKFTKWDKSPLLNANTIINEGHTFTAYFDWSGLTAGGLVTTEAFKDPNGKWTNNFAPTIAKLKEQLVWKEKDQVKELPAGTTIKFYDEAGNELKSDEDVFELISEQNKADKEEVVRTVNIKVKATFKDGKEPQELTIPITVYKNVYEALNKDGDKPKYLSDAEKLTAKEGGLKDVTGDYVKVTVQPTEKNTNKDAKVYFVNPKAWVTIPEVAWSQGDKDKTDFLKWTADKKEQNENKEENGIFDFTKRHKFAEETLIKPLFTKDVVPQEGEDKPKVPDNFVKVIVKTTDKATSELTQTFWVNPTKEVTIPVANPTGKENQEVDIPKLGKKKVSYVFNQWQKVQAGEADDNLAEVKPAVEIDLAKNQYTDKVTVIEATYFERFAATPIVKPIKTDELHTPEGKEITDKDLIGKITPPKNKEIESITVVEKPDPSKRGKQEAKVIVKYKDGSTQGSNDKPIVIPVEVHKNIIPEAPGGQRPKEALDNYVKVIFTAGTGGSVSGDLVYYVSPEVEVDMTNSAKAVTKTPSVGYFVNGEKWTNKDNKVLKGTFTDPETVFEFNFDKSKDIVEKTEDPNQVIPEGYVKVTFKTEDEAKGKIDTDKLEKIYYVNPKAGITLKVLGEGEKATGKQLAVPKTTPATNYEFDQWYETIDQSTAITSERVHVAKFKLAKVTLTYDANGAEGTVPPTLTVDHGTTVRLAGPGQLKKANAVFAGWKIGDKTYQTADEVTLNENTKAIAQWNVSTHTVMFNSMGGTTVETQVVNHGEKLKAFDAPTLDGKVFMGWKEKGKESEEGYFDLTQAINEDKVLVAQWQDAVQKIDENAKVEEQFIKVTFLKGNHGKLKDGQVENLEKVTYKVAKGLTFDQAKEKGLVVPGIQPAQYFKAKEENNGWDKELKLEGKDTIFTAQYAPVADVIPVDPNVTPDDKLQEHKPEGTVLVEFVVDDAKAFMVATSKFYVAANKEVTITPPTVYNRPGENKFEGWEDITLDEKGLLKASFAVDTSIVAKGLALTEMEIVVPEAGFDFIEVKRESLAQGVTGHLEIIRGNQKYSAEPAQEYINRRKIGKFTVKQVRFGFKIPAEVGKLQSGDLIRHWAENKTMKSNIKEITIK